MLFNKWASAALLVLQATLGAAGRVEGHERRQLPIAKDTVKLTARGETKFGDGLREGKEGDSLLTYGLASCPGLAASGKAGKSGVNKVVAHVLCASGWDEKLAEWYQTVKDSGMTEVKVGIAILNPAKAEKQEINGQMVSSEPLMAYINEEVKRYAGYIDSSFKTTVREETDSKSPGGTIEVREDGSIWAEGNRLN